MSKLKTAKETKHIDSIVQLEHCNINSYLDLANGSGQLASDSTHAGLGKKTGRSKWVAQSMTLTQSFKGRVKTELTRIFTHEKNIYKK